MIDKLVIPVRGYGLWGTLYGYLALEGDLTTISGIGFYNHKKLRDWEVKSIILNGKHLGRACGFMI